VSSEERPAALYIVGDTGQVVAPSADALNIWFKRPINNAAARPFDDDEARDNSRDDG
jgi:hypothetical protein